MSDFQRLDKTGLTHLINELATKITSLIPGVFSRSSNGVVPQAPSGSGTTKYLREDGTWSVPTASVPLATSSVRGGAKVGFTESGKNYPVELDSDERMFVNVPWTDTNTTYTGLPDVYVGTAANTQTKVGTSPNYVLRSGSRFTVRIKNANSYNGLIKLNINSTGAKNVYINGAVSSSSNKTLPAGDYSVYYDGSYYYFNTSDEITSLNSALTPQGIGTGVSGVNATKCGHVVTLSNFNTPVWTLASDGIAYTLPVALRPYLMVDILDTYSKKRFQLGTDGTLRAKTAISNEMIRFTITYIAP
jgi:hypothetical protein